MATEQHVKALKQRVSRSLLRLRGVNGVGIERADGPDDYALVVHIVTDDPAVKAAVKQRVADEAVRIVASGKFKKLSGR